MQFRKTFKYRLYPSKAQQHTINNQLELCRQLYNEMRNIKKETYTQAHQSLSKFDLINTISYFNINQPKYKEVHSQVKQNVCDRVDKAFKNMYARIKRGEDNPGYPRIKGKYQYKSICYPQAIYNLFKNNKLIISKIGEVNIKLHHSIDGTIKTMTISRTSTNKYYVAFACVVEKEIPIRAELKSIGVDVGLNHFMTLSDGTHIDNPRYLRKSEQKLARTQCKQSRKKLRSHNRNKHRLKVAVIHEKVKNQRADFLHKLSTQLTNNYSIIGIENLNIVGMLKNRRLSRSISDVGWGMFYNQLYYKAEHAGSIVQESERFYPSTKTCNKCGSVQDMPLHKRIYECKCCGNIEDRDTNAAINLDQNALRIINMNTVGMTGINACGDVPLGTSMNQEATHF